MISAILVIVLTVLFLPLELPSQAAGSTYPTWRTPVEDEEIRSFQNYTVTWYAPTSGTVSHYLFSLRKLKEKNDTTKEELIYSNVTVNTRTFTIPKNKITNASYYRVAVGAVMTNGATYWITRNFFSSATRGVQSGNVISFKFSPYLTQAEKLATYYSAQTWKNAIGIEVANTYPSTTVPNHDDAIDTSDGENIVFEGFLGENNAIMTTFIRRFDGYVVEADIVTNYELNITVGATPTSFDFQNVMTHEWGHVIGLCDKYESHTAEWTMYGHGGYNETKRRTLEAHDIQYARIISGVA